MVSAITVVLIALPVYLLYSTYTSLQKNISAAKLSGLRYVVTPVHIYHRAWLITYRLWLPLLKKFPTSWIGEWTETANPDWCWTELFDPFTKYGEVFISVSPYRNIVWVASAEGVQQITQHRDAFPKPLESYAILDLYGRNIVTTEGTEWKKHRKVISPGLNEKNNALVFQESIAQTQGMLRRWTGPDGRGNVTLTDVPADSMRVTLHIITKVGFGVGLSWPGEERSQVDKKSTIDYGSSKVPKGFTMTFEHALVTLLESLAWVLIFPGWLLKRIPIANARESFEAFTNWGRYMKAIHDQKLEEAKQGEHIEGMDIMGALVKSSMTDQAPSPRKRNSLGSAEKGEAGRTTLSTSEKLGNAFVFLIAGHETTANSVHFSLILLALSPGSQRRLQKEVEDIFGDTKPEEWDYDSCINACLGGMLGAVLNEELRLMPPVISIPKSVRKDQDQTIVLDGKKTVLPKGSFVNLNAAGIHRNPRYWPSRGPSKVSGKSTDLDDFIPERWLVSKSKKDSVSDFATPEQNESEEEDYGGFTGRDTAPQLFHPVRGSFIPFSDGPRSCLGRRLAQVEFVAVFSVIFQKYSVELAVDEWATDAEVTKMGKQEKVELYKKAQVKAREILRGASTRITLKLHGSPGHIPIRLVRKGEERFVNLIE